MNNKYFSMININTRDMITYYIYDEYIESITEDNIISRFSKNKENDNQIVMDLINNLIKQGYIINQMNIF